MKFTYENNNVYISECTLFNLEKTFTCGQCFRFDKKEDGKWFGVVNDKELTLLQEDEDVILENVSQKEFEDFWYYYFDLDRNYEEINNAFSNNPILNTALNYGKGIRILKQEPWEALCSFIISQNNNIPRIKGIIERFCELFGKEIIYKDKKYYTFPKASELRGIKTDDLAPLRAGFRDKYIVDAVNKVNSGEVSLDLIKTSDTSVAREELLKIKGVGRKVSDCVLLFGAGKREVFPVDVWVKRVMNELYYDELSDGDIFAFADKKFGKNAGLAQQYLFYYMRENSKEAK